jgi:hypothetical protein
MPPPKATKHDRPMVLLHGTTVRRAMQIEADDFFRIAAGGEIWFVSRSNRDVAEFFAIRRAIQENDRPAVVTAAIDDLIFQSLRKGGDAALKQFDPQDDPFLRGRSQWVLTARGIAVLNPKWEEITWEEVIDTNPKPK